MKDENSVSKRALWRFVNLKIKRLVHHYHVISVITILFDEMLIDLVKGKQIRIKNFGNITLKWLKPRKYFDVRYQRVMQAKAHKILRFTIAPKFRKKLVEHVDLDKTLKDD